MAESALAIRRTSLVTAVGLNGPSACAAIRAKVTNPTETRFMGGEGKWVMAHQVQLERRWSGRTRLVKLAAMAIDEALAELPPAEWSSLPLLLCIAEPDRPGRLPELDTLLFLEVLQELGGATFAHGSAVVAHGRVSVAVAMAQARTLLKAGAPQVLIVAVDSLVHGPTLAHHLREARLLTPSNSNGFMPGEGAGALLVGRPDGTPALACTGLGLAVEPAAIESGEPLRADGLSAAIKAALGEAGLEMHNMDFRITDLSGEQYYFKEAALALTRVLRHRKEEFENWHPAECIGEAGALAGAAVLVVADMACRKGYALGHEILAHMSNDAGQRAAMTLHFGAT
jgi:3-oxoacyl-[acyl-carrier-protein] synthase-1